MNQDDYNNDNNRISLGNNEYGKEPMLKCPKCGELMKLSARCCIRCGELNYLNHKNDSVKPSFNLGKKLKQKEDLKAAKKAAKAKYVNGEDVSIKEKSRRYVFFKRLTDLLIVILLIIAVINYKFLIKTFNDFRAKYYIKQVDKIIEQIDNEFKDKECNSIGENGSLVYSFFYSDDYFKTGVSLYTFNYFSGYVTINKTANGNKYVISITDGKYGFKDVPYEDLDIDSITKIDSIDSPSNTVSCS